MDIQEIAQLHIDGLTHPSTEGLDGSIEHIPHGGVEPGNLVVGEAGAATEGIDSSMPANFVGIGVADTGYESLIGEYALDLAMVPAQSLAKDLQGQGMVGGLRSQLAKGWVLVQVSGQL